MVGCGAEHVGDEGSRLASGTTDEGDLFENSSDVTWALCRTLDALATKPVASAETQVSILHDSPLQNAWRERRYFGSHPARIGSRSESASEICRVVGYLSQCIVRTQSTHVGAVEEVAASEFVAPEKSETTSAVFFLWSMC